MRQLISRLPSLARCCVIAAAGAGCSLQDFDGLGTGLPAIGGSAGSDSPEAGVGGTDPGLGGAGGSDGTGGTEGPETGAPVENPNLFTDPSFEDGHSGWIPFGNSLILDVSDQAHSGTHCIQSFDRTQTYEGPSRRIAGLVTKGAAYEASGWVRAEGGPTINLAIKQSCQGASDSYITFASAVETTAWTQVAGIFTVPDCVLTEYLLYFEGPPGGVDFFLDDVSLRLVQ